MAKQWKAIIDTAPFVGVVNGSMAYVPTGLAVGVNEISVYIGDNVPEARQLEFVDAWRWLYAGVRERNLLDAQFKGVVLYTAANINSLTAENRRTASELTFFTEDDVIIAMGANVTALGERLDIAEAFRALGNFALESTLKAA